MTIIRFQNDKQQSSSFVSRKVNSSTFLIVEDDEFGEQPYIYVKIYPQHILITDTGCDAPKNKERTYTSLRKYIENYPLPLNEHKCLNPEGQKKYVILCSHCHYDHILGLTQFLSADPAIIASDYDKEFLIKDLPEHSLCKYMDRPTPKYKVSHWASHLAHFSTPDMTFNIQFLHIPGHTPDSLAWYDMVEHQLYIGDTFYERKRSKPILELSEGESTQVEGNKRMQDAIIFPKEEKNEELQKSSHSTGTEEPRVKVCCGHMTHNEDAERTILEVRDIFQKIISGQVPASYSFEKRGILTDFWLEHDDSKYSIIAPRYLFEEAQRHFNASGNGESA